MRDMSLSALVAEPFRRLHADIRRAGHAEYWLKGGRGSGKSSFVSLEIVTGLLRDPLANAIIYRRWAAYLRESVYEQMAWAIDSLGLRPWFRFLVSPMELVYLPTGQRILFRGSDDPGKSKSIKLSKGYFKYLWFEELTEFDSVEDLSTIEVSVFRGGGDARTVAFASYNPPKSAQNWVNDAVMRPDPRRMVHHSDYTQLPPEWLGASFLAKADAKRLTNETAYRHEYLGEVTGTGGQVFDNVTVREITGLERVTFDNPKVGLDFGFAVDPDAVTVSHYNPALRRLYLFGEYFKTGSSFDATASAIRRLNPWGVPVTADSAEPRSIHELTERGIRASGAYKPPGSVEHGVRWLQDLAEIVIDPALCPNAVREFQAYEYERDRLGNFRASLQRKDDHTIDSVRYGNEDHIAYRQATAGRREDYGV